MSSPPRSIAAEPVLAGAGARLRGEAARWAARAGSMARARTRGPSAHLVATVPQRPAADAGRCGDALRPTAALYLSVGLVAGAVVALQIALMRIFAVGSWAHFGSLVVSLAMLGFGLTSALMCIKKGWFEHNWQGAARGALMAFGPLLVAVNLAAQQIPFNAPLLVADPAQKWHLAGNFLLYALPVLAGAFFLGTVFLKAQSAFGRVYFADLTGSGLCGLLMLGAMPLLGPANLLIVPLLLWLAGSVLWLVAVGQARAIAGIGAIAAACVGLHLAAPALGLPTLALMEHTSAAVATAGAQLVRDEWARPLAWSMLAIAGVAALSLVLLPLLFGWRTIFSRNRGKVRTILYFACLGAGYILVEVGLIAKFAPALGNAVVSASVLITGMLVFSGLGSLASERYLDRAREVMPRLFLAIAALLAGYGLALDPALEWIATLPPALRLPCCFALIFPPAFLMGFPMPIAMTWLSRLGKDHMFLWAWGINGCFSVVGAAMVPVIAITFGPTAVLMVSAGAYLLAILGFLAVLLPAAALRAQGAG